MEVLFTSPSIPKPKSKKAEPLFKFEDASILEYVRSLPRFDQWGLVPKGHIGPRVNPASEAQAAAVEEGAESMGSSDAVGESASGGLHSSVGNASSSRDAPPEAEIQVLSSSSSDQYHVAPSRCTEEEEESTSGGSLDFSGLDTVAVSDVNCSTLFF